MLIGLTGHAGVGKDTAASIISEIGFETSTRVLYPTRYAFADPLKQACSSAFAIPIENFHDPFLKEEIHPYWNKSPRELAQYIGTEMFRESFGKAHWIKVLSLKLLIDFDSPREVCAVVTDVRFPNEAEWVLSQPDSCLIQITRPLKNGAVGIPNHQSEQTLDINSLSYKGTVYTINNNSTIKDFKKSILTIISYFKSQTGTK